MDAVRVTGSGARVPREPGVPELTSVQELARQLVSTLDLQTALDELAGAAARIAAASESEPGQALVLRADDGGVGPRTVVVAPAAEAGSPLALAVRGHAESVLDSGRHLQLGLDQMPAGPDRGRLQEAGITAVALVPIPVTGRVFGVLVAGARAGAAITAPRLRRLELIADLGGLAIANATAYERERRALRSSQGRLRELALLHDATRVFSSTLSVEEIEREVASTAARLVAPADEDPRRAAFLHVEGGFATVVQEDDLSGLSHAGIRFPVSAHAMVEAALVERRAVAAPLAELRPGTPALRRAIGELAATDAAYAPVFVQDEPFGVVVVTVEDGRGFSIDQLRRLEAIASLAELAIANGRHFEAVRREGERMAALEEIKSKFLRLASHELRSPLAVLRGYVSMLRDGTFEDSADQLPEIYSILDAKAGQMELLVTQMLEAARLEEGRLRMDLRRIDVRKPVRAAFDDVRLVARGTHDMTLHAPDGRVDAMADAGRITTIVANLLDNAVKYSPGGGPVTCTVHQDGDRVLIEVADHGLGIAEADMATLFTRFGRIETAENRNIQGTGLGLYLSRELAQMQGGALTATSEAGRGSTFTLSVPAAPPGC